MTACKSRMKTFKTMLHNQENQKRSVEDEHQRLKAQHDGLKNDLQAKQHDIDALKVHTVTMTGRG